MGEVNITSLHRKALAKLSGFRLDQNIGFAISG